MRVEIVEDDAEAFRLRVHVIDEVFDKNSLRYKLSELNGSYTSRSCILFHVIDG